MQLYPVYILTLEREEQIERQFCSIPPYSLPQFCVQNPIGPLDVIRDYKRQIAIDLCIILSMV